jgi:hypothetical protein
MRFTDMTSPRPTGTGASTPGGAVTASKDSEVNPTPSAWVRSSFSDNSGGNCVEVRRFQGARAIRDTVTNDPDAVLVVADASWDSFVAGVRVGEFD